MCNKHNTDNTDFVETLIAVTVADGITDPVEIVQHIAGTYTKNGKEITKNE